MLVSDILICLIILGWPESKLVYNTTSYQYALDKKKMQKTFPMGDNLIRNT